MNLPYNDVNYQNILRTIEGGFLMGEVHEAISKHSKAQNKIVTTFLKLDAEREHYIAEAVELCQRGAEFSVDRINTVTAEINELAKNGIAPIRKLVTKEMVREYVEKLKQR